MYICSCNKTTSITNKHKDCFIKYIFRDVINYRSVLLSVQLRALHSYQQKEFNAKRSKSFIEEKTKYVIYMGR